MTSAPASELNNGCYFFFFFLGRMILSFERVDGAHVYNLFLFMNGCSLRRYTYVGVGVNTVVDGGFRWCRTCVAGEACPQQSDAYLSCPCPTSKNSHLHVRKKASPSFFYFSNPAFRVVTDVTFTTKRRVRPRTNYGRRRRGSRIEPSGNGAILPSAGRRDKKWCDFFLREKKHQGILQFSFPPLLSLPPSSYLSFQTNGQNRAYEGSDIIFYFTLLRRRRPASLDINRQLPPLVVYQLPNFQSMGNRTTASLLVVLFT